MCTKTRSTLQGQTDVMTEGKSKDLSTTRNIWPVMGFHCRGRGVRCYVMETGGFRTAYFLFDEENSP